MIEGKSDLVGACRTRGMRVAETPVNLLESVVEADGVLDGMEVRVEVHCVAGLPGDSTGTVTLKGNLGQVLAVLERLWPALQRRRA
ncbi:hypothetical protein [Caldinitratiruptor microaerophilus]|uniref:Uncharacterized protein n=1 Tax=Caldinitratiruptor microaerophilus TaxID=671077 RepID=A0AA35CIK2_9FIRM|nr:hypothetical protein [Caldinitratiruptor microaerophilus]BDG59109.1 hypothetical protein caldi_01990 [Caldinitratiruptor microaerophilus]